MNYHARSVTLSLPLFAKYLLLVMVFIPAITYAQTKQKVIIERADAYRFDNNINSDVQRLVGDVVIRQDSTRFYCDSAWLNEVNNSFEAFSNVHIKVNDTVDVFGDRMLYNGNTRIAELFDHVRMIDKNTILTTEHLIYNRVNKTALYDDHGTIVNDSNTLTSMVGLYFTEPRIFHFRDDVVLTNPDQSTYSDTLIYNTNSEVAYFVGPTLIRTEENMVYCEHGWYDTQNNTSKLDKRPRLSNSDQVLTADSLDFDKAMEFGRAYGNIQMEDTGRNMIILGHYAEVWNTLGKAFVTGDAEAITYDDSDSLFMHADTFWVHFSEADSMQKRVNAYYGVRFYRKNMQGKCDSLEYRTQDSTIYLYKDPVLWSGGNQLTADSISIAIVNKQIDSLVMYNSAFIVSRDTTDTFNQIKGKNMVAYFRKNQLSSIAVDGNAQTVYYVREEDGFLIGINLAESSTMRIRIKNNEVENISYQTSPEETMYPSKQLSNKETILKGFSWQEHLRPKQRQDIFVKPKENKGADLPE